MESAAARQLCKINNRFYRTWAESFSQTRAQAWKGWENVCDELERAGAGASRADMGGEVASAHAGSSSAANTHGAGVAGLNATAARAGAGAPSAGAEGARAVRDAAVPLVLDVAAGNLRFERCCEVRWGAGAVRFVAVDDCAPLASEPLARMPQTAFVPLDVVSWLIDADEAAEAAGGGDAPMQAVGVAGGGDAPASAAQAAGGGDAPAAETCFGGALAEGFADAAVCFGFFHHVPGRRLRARLLAELVSAVRPGGIVAASFWRFMDDDRLARKALADDARARAYAAEADRGPSCDAGARDGACGAGRADAPERFGIQGENGAPESGSGERGSSCGITSDLLSALEPGDHLLGWQNRPGAFRYCHSFSDSELERLVESVEGRARLVRAFDADGRSGALNRYLVFERL